MILQEGIRVVVGYDSGQLRKGLRGSLADMSRWQKGSILAITAVTAASVKMAAQLDKDLRFVATLTDMSTRDMGRLRGEIQKLGTEFGRSFNELARANYQAVSGGFKSINQSIQLTRAGAKLAEAGNADLVSSTEAVVKALKAYKLESDQAEMAAAQLWGITRDGIVTVEQLGRFLQDLPATMAASGIQFHEMSAAMSTLTGVTGHASSAVEQLRSMLIKMEQNGITGTLVERVERFAGKSLGQLTEMLGDQTAARGALILAQNLNTFRQNVEGARNVTDDFDAAVKKMNSGALAEWEKLQQNINGMMQDLGALLLPAVESGLRGINSMLRSMNTSGTLSADDRETLAWLNRPGAIAGANMQNTVDAWLSGGGLPWGGRAGGPTSVNPEQRVGPPLGTAGTSALRDGRFPWLSDSEALGMGFGVEIPDAIDSSDEALRKYVASLKEQEKAAKEVERAVREQSAASMIAAEAGNMLAYTLESRLTASMDSTQAAIVRFIVDLLRIAIKIANKEAGSDLGASGGMTTSDGGFTGIGINPNASGGYISSRGSVGPGEFAFNANAVRNIGVGALERAAAVADAGGSYSTTINQTIGGGDPNRVAIATKHAVLAGIREGANTGTARLYRKMSLGGV